MLAANVNNTTSAPNGITAVISKPTQMIENFFKENHVIIAITGGICIGIIILALTVAYVIKARFKRSENNLCRAASISSSLSFSSLTRRFSLRSSKNRSRFRSNILTPNDLAEYVQKVSVIHHEFREGFSGLTPLNKAPMGCESKNRFINLIPNEESRVRLSRRNDDETTEYINASFLKGFNETPNSYIACQAPLDSTVHDFWRMIWEQESRVIIQATKLIENGKSMCAEYLPESMVDHIFIEEFLVSIENRNWKNKYMVTTINLKNTRENEIREITHYWYDWPESGVPVEQDSIILMLLEARLALKTYAQAAERASKEREMCQKNNSITIDSRELAFYLRPLVIHCSTGIGRTGTIIACDMVIHSLQKNGSMDLPKIVFEIRRERPKAVSSKEEYEFIYKVAYKYILEFADMYEVNIE